jgi:hypothetical protein
LNYKVADLDKTYNFYINLSPSEFIKNYDFWKIDYPLPQFETAVESATVCAAGYCSQPPFQMAKGLACRLERGE